MPYNIAIFADKDIVSALQRYSEAEQPDFVIKYIAGSYYDCFEPTVRDHCDILMLQVKSPIANAQDLMYDLQSASFAPMLLLFELQGDGRLRYTTSDKRANPKAAVAADYFEQALSGDYRCSHASFRTTVWDDNVQRFAEKVGRNECLKEILRGCGEEEFVVHRERYALDLKETGYYLFFWELMDLEYSNHRLYKDIYNFIGETLQQECRETIATFNGGEVFYCTLNLICIIINDLPIKSEAKRNAQFEEMIKKLAVFTGCKTAHRYLSGRIANVKGLREAYDKYHLQKPMAFFLRDVSVLEPGLINARKKIADMERVNGLLREITNYLRYDILNGALTESLHTLYFDILKPSMSYTLFYTCAASVSSAMAEAQDLDEEQALVDITGPGLLQYSSIEEQYEIILGQIQKLQTQSANKRGTKNSLVLKVVDYIAENYSREITVSEIAGALFINSNYLSHIFKRTMGVGLIKYLINYRIDQAKRLLSESDALIYIIAEEVGFNEFRHFSKTFKKITGLSPAEYRKQKR